MEQPPLDELRVQPMPQAGAALHGAIPAVLARWRESVKQILPQADELTRKQLEDSLPELLERIATALTSKAPAPTDRLIEVSPEHGQTRYHQDFSLNQLIIEYHMLRRIVLQEMAAALRRDLSVDESVAVNQGIDVVMRQGAVEFSEFQTRAMKNETAAMTKFLSFLSHDLRGGLNGAVLMIEVLKRQLAGETRFASAVEDLDLVRRSILDTVGTMERFLHAEKLRLGRMPVKNGPLSVSDLLAEVQRGATFALNEKAMTMVVTCEPPDLSLTSDRQLLTLVLQNLVSNAIKYGHEGKVELKASRPEGTAGSLGCRFTVADSGPGIAPEKLTELFSAFARGETYGQKGVGLGLFIAKQSADLLGARLWAESKIGDGATFYLDVTNRAI